MSSGEARDRWQGAGKVFGIICTILPNFVEQIPLSACWFELLKPTGLQTGGSTVDDGIHVVSLTRLTCCSGVSEYSRTTTSTSPEDGEEIWKL